jgi:type II secretory pathway component PulM
MPKALTARDRRALIVGLCVLLPAVAWRPYQAALTDTREKLVTQRDLLARELALLEDLERYPASYRSADSALKRIAPRLFDEPDDVLATARMTSYVAGQALTSRVLLQEAEPRPARRTKDGIRALQVEIRAEGDTEGLLRFLQALERGNRMVTVEELSITRTERAVERGRPAVAVLSFTATLNGYALPDSIAARGAAMTALAPEPD